MAQEQWARILEDIFSFERDPGLGRVLFIAVLAVITIIVAIHLKRRDARNEEKRDDTDNC